VPIVVVQGETDAMGRPEHVAAALLASVYAVPGDHSLKKNPGLAAAAALSWLTEVLPG
jgi:predicted alpha/beta-hydrolase family hydrolase